MRILIVNTYYDPEMLGGAEHSVKKLAEQLVRMGMDCGVLCTGEKDEDCVLNGVRIFRRCMKKRCRSIDIGEKSRREKLFHRIQELGCWQNLSVIDSVLDEFRPDVVHTNCLYDITNVIWIAARRRRIRVVHTLRDYYLVCPRVQLMRRGTLQRCRKPCAVCWFYRILNRWYSGYVDVVTAPSQFTLRTILEEGLFRGKQGKVIANAANCDAIEPKGRTSDVFTVVYLGELTQKKGLQWLLESFDLIDREYFRLFIAGRGAFQDQVLCCSAKDSRIRFLGQLDESGVNETLKLADVLICPSMWDEPFGRVVIDAYSHGIPVIASDRGALPEIVKDGVTGMIVPAGDVQMLAEAMMTYDENQEMWSKHARNAAREMEKFSLEKQALAFLEIYRGEGEGRNG